MTSLIMKYKEAELSDEMANERRATAWSDLLGVNKLHPDDDEFASTLRSIEDAYMEEMYADQPNAKKKDGTWKYRKFKLEVEAGEEEQFGGLPMAYLSSKSTVIQCRKQKIDLTGKGSISKDFATKALSAKKATREEKTPFDKAHYHSDQLLRLWPNLTTGEKNSILLNLDPIL
jgi:hypothetical protein